MAVNKCDELFGKNGELVEFRKKQVLEGALEIVQRHYKEMPNKMEVVAALLGKKLGEEFRVDEKDCRKNMICKITERGLFFYHSNYEAWWKDSGLLSELITGEAVIVDARD